MKINHIRNDTIEGFYQKLSDSFGFNLSPQWQHPWSYCVLKSLPYSPIFKVLNIADWTVLCRIKLKCYLSMYLAINVMTILLQFHDLGYDYDIYDIRTRCFQDSGELSGGVSELIMISSTAQLHTNNQAQCPLALPTPIYRKEIF